MEKDVKRITVNYTYDASHTRAHYTLNGIHFMNAGDFIETAVKAAHGLNAVKDSNGRFDKCSDIPEYNASVKSSEATLCNVVLADNFAETLDKFFEKVTSREFWYVVMIEEDLHIYKMDKAEFREFVEKFAFFNERKQVRIRKTGAKTIRWLEAKLQPAE